MKKQKQTMRIKTSKTEKNDNKFDITVVHVPGCSEGTLSTRVSLDLAPSPSNSTNCVVMNDHQTKKILPILEKNTVRTLPRLLHVDRLSSLSHCRGPSGPPKCSLCRLHRQLRTGRLIIVTSFLSGLEFASRALGRVTVFQSIVLSEHV